MALINANLSRTLQNNQFNRDIFIRFYIYQKHEQSKFINNHLFGLVLKESAY